MLVDGLVFVLALGMELVLEAVYRGEAACIAFHVRRHERASFLVEDVFRMHLNNMGVFRYKAFSAAYIIFPHYFIVYKAVLFDLDGTLVHTPFEYIRDVVGNTLRDLGLSSDENGIRRFWYEPFREITLREVFGIEPDRFWPVMNGYDTPDARVSAARPYNDVGFIAELKASGYRTGIVTGARIIIMRSEVEMLGSGSFDAVVRAQRSSGVEPKPHPQGIQRCLDELQVSPGEAMYVGNGPEDIEAAKAANVLDVHIDRKEHPLNGVEPSVRVSSLYELRPILPPHNAP